MSRPSPRAKDASPAATIRKNRTSGVIESLFLLALLLALLLAFPSSTGANSSPMATVTLQGKVGMITENSWLVGNTWVSVDANTEIVGNPEVGDMVRVDASLTNGGFLALRIEKMPGGVQDEVTIEGAITKIKETRWTVGEYFVLLDENTVVAGETPAVGLSASVEGLEQGDGSILARSIFVFSPDSVLPVGGVVAEMRDTTLRLLAAENITTSAAVPVTITVDAGTLLDESGGVLEPGAWVHGEMESTDSGLHAVRISVYTPPEIAICGTLEPFDQGQVASLWQVDGQLLRIPPTARIVGTLVPDAPVYVRGLRIGDGSIWAKEVYPVEVSTFSGVLSVVGKGEYPQEWVMKVYDARTGRPRRIRFLVTEDTFFDITWGPLQIGQNVQITVIPYEDEEWLALEVVTLPSAG